METEEEKGRASGSATAVATSDGKDVSPVHLLDELWFFHNILSSSKPTPRAVLATPLPEKAKEEAGTTETAASPSPISISNKSPENKPKAARKLLRVPSMPAYRYRPAAESDVVICSPKRSSDGTGTINGVIRHKPLVRAPSLPAYNTDEVNRPRPMRNSKLQHSSSMRATSNSTTPTKSRSPRIGKEQGVNNDKHLASSQTQLFVEANFKRFIFGKNWRSSSDLESFEVQGFKDLGFVFDEDGSIGNLANVIPGLRLEKRTASEVTRPYLSEAWYGERSAPPKLEWAEKRSAAHVKEQLRFWARAVACTVRQD